MAARVSHLWRHPIKGCGVEGLERTVLAANAAMPWDRVWGVAHDGAKIAPGTEGWAPCPNFARGARTADLMAIRAVTDETAGCVTLSHPRRPEITVNPDTAEDAARLVAWVAPLCDPERAVPAFVVRAGARGMTDSDFPSIAILNGASLAALADRIGAPLAMERFRGNVWLDGLEPWAEFDLVGRDIRVGDATLTVRERITRCKATTVNTETGRVDADTLGALQAGWGHKDFGVYAVVTSGGGVAVGDPVTL